MPIVALYNARAKPRSACMVLPLSATNHRDSEGRGVFHAGGTPISSLYGPAGVPRAAGMPSARSMRKVLLLQLGVGTLVALLFWGTGGTVSGYSAMLGALTCVVPNAFLALRLAVPRDKQAERPLMRAAFVGELGKLAITVIMFTVIFSLVRPLAPAALFAGFIAGQLTTFAGFLMKDGDTKTRTTSVKNGD